MVELVPVLGILVAVIIPVSVFIWLYLENKDKNKTIVVTLFTGVGLFLFGVFFLGSILKGVGALVASIGLGQIIAGYLYPNTSEELTSAVEDFEKK